MLARIRKQLQRPTSLSAPCSRPLNLPLHAPLFYFPLAMSQCRRHRSQGDCIHVFYFSHERPCERQSCCVY
jgi:hypothetical protein